MAGKAREKTLFQISRAHLRLVRGGGRVDARVEAHDVLRRRQLADGGTVEELTFAILWRSLHHPEIRV